MHLFNIFSNCLTILFNISHPTDWHVLLLFSVKCVIFSWYFFLSRFLKIINFGKNSKTDPTCSKKKKKKKIQKN